MLAFSVETILLLSLAYLLGCSAACLARRVVGATADAAKPRGAAVARNAATVPHGRRVPIAAMPPAPPRPMPTRDAFRRADTLFPALSPAEAGSHLPDAGAVDAPDLQGTISRFETALDGLRPTSIRSPAGPQPAARPAPAAPRDDFAQDLKLIRGIGALLELKLKAAGISRYEQIAAWTDADVARISRMLGARGRIEQERWIEQARQLAGYPAALPGKPATAELVPAATPSAD